MRKCQERDLLDSASIYLLPGWIGQLCWNFSSPPDGLDHIGAAAGSRQTEASGFLAVARLLHCTSPAVRGECSSFKIQPVRAEGGQAAQR